MPMMKIKKNGKTTCVFLFVFYFAQSLHACNTY